jgi:heme-degrading monooxygenase HmoA
VISRHWTGVAKPERAEAYRRHLVTETFPQLSRIPGFLRASVLSRSVQRGTEFRVVTEWKSLDAIRAFAGRHVETAVVPAVVQQWMASYDSEVVHYELQERWPPPPARRTTGHTTRRRKPRRRTTR